MENFNATKRNNLVRNLVPENYNYRKFAKIWSFKSVEKRLNQAFSRKFALLSCALGFNEVGVVFFNDLDYILKLTN